MVPTVCVCAHECIPAHKKPLSRMSTDTDDDEGVMMIRTMMIDHDDEDNDEDVMMTMFAYYL